MPRETSPADLAAARRAFVIAPAGCGKTELIARAIELSDARSLVLTHTHSGVNAIQTRLQRLGVPREKFEVATIAGWGLRWASAYPHLAGATFDLPTGPEWQRVDEAAIELLQRRAVRDVLRRSFSGVFVDEYQDCNQRQHQIVMALADVLPCRLLGDPLQGIFEFAGPSVQWEEDIVPSFERLADLTTPHRWLNANPDLGEWISEVRAKFIAGESIDMGAMPVAWSPLTPRNQLEVCRRAAVDAEQSVVALGKWEGDCHDFASRTGGLFGSMETLDCKRLVDFMEAIDRERTGYRQVIEFFRFACDCITGVKTQLMPFVDRYRQGESPHLERLTTSRRVIGALNRLVEQPCPCSLVDAARAIESYPGARIFRRELWNEMKTTLLTFLSGGHASLAETAWYVRDRSRRNGRRSENRVVSRTLLVKGLEFDQAVVLDAGVLTAKEAYVAMSRGSRGLAVLSSNQSRRWPVPENVLA